MGLLMLKSSWVGRRQRAKLGTGSRTGSQTSGARRAQAASKAGARSKPGLWHRLQGWLHGCFRRERPEPAAPDGNRRPRAPAASSRRSALPEPMLMLMQGQLASLLGQHPRARGTLPHLALVERVLRARGEAAVVALPDAVLERALEQLEALTDDGSHAGLTELRRRLARAVRPPLAERAHDDLLSTFGTPDKLQVSEVGLSVFEEVEASNP